MIAVPDLLEAETDHDEVSQGGVNHGSDMPLSILLCMKFG